VSSPRPELKGALAGVVATLSMDVLTGIAIRLGLLAPLPPSLIGRWFASVAQGRPIHADIAAAPPLSHELALAIAGHYAIGITLASFYVWLASRIGAPVRSAGVALGYGLCTNVLPWMVMFPAMGYGFFGLGGPAGTHLFASSLASHLFYGVGLGLGVRWLVPPP
jgi:hypothetical protein